MGQFGFFTSVSKTECNIIYSYILFQGINTSKAVAQDEEPDLGKTLSPLGSTSSLQDLMEASSSTQPTPEPVKATWIGKSTF